MKKAFISIIFVLLMLKAWGMPSNNASAAGSPNLQTPAPQQEQVDNSYQQDTENDYQQPVDGGRTFSDSSQENANNYSQQQDQSTDSTPTTPEEKGLIAGIIGFLGYWALALVILYFLPVIVAAVLRQRNLPAIFILNIFLGWTGVGWVVALVMAFWQSEKQQSVVYIDQKPYNSPPYQPPPDSPNPPPQGPPKPPGNDPFNKSIYKR